MRTLDERILNDLGQQLVDALTDALKNKNKSATGNLINSISYEVIKGSNPVVNIIADDYLIYVDRGRKPGSFPPIRKIAEWCRVKGIDESASFPIAQSIYKFGIEPTNVIDMAERKVLSNLNQFEKDLAEDLEKIIIESFKEL